MGYYDKAKTGKCDVRLTSDEMSQLTELSNAYGITKSDVMRKALNDMWKYCRGVEESSEEDIGGEE